MLCPVSPKGGEKCDDFASRSTASPFPGAMLESNECLRKELVRHCKLQFGQYDVEKRGSISSKSMTKLVKSVFDTLHLEHAEEDIDFSGKSSYTFLDFQEMVYTAMQAQLDKEMGALREERQAFIQGVAGTPKRHRTSTSHHQHVASTLQPAPAYRLPKVGRGNVFVVDIGSGEVGFNSFTDSHGTVEMKNVKISLNFLKEVIEKNAVDEFAAKVTEHFPHVGEKTVYFGLTGANRDSYANDPGPIQNFFSALQRKMKLDWFVPSGTMEAECELNAVRYLAKLTGIGEIEGVLSGGGGSCQISSKCPKSKQSNVYSIPFGNKSPEKIHLFGDTVRDKLLSWTTVLSQAIGKLDLQELHGTYVGISAMFYGAKAAKIAGSAVSKYEALAAIDHAINDSVEKNNERNMYNLAMVRCLILMILAEDAKIFFQRNWKVGEEELVATWTLGLYVSK